MAKKQKTLDEKSLRELEDDLGWAIGALETWGGNPDSIDLAIKIPTVRENMEKAITTIIDLKREINNRAVAPAYRCEEKA